MPVIVMEAWDAVDKDRVDAGHPSGSKDITLTINPHELTYSTQIGRWRKRSSQRGRYPIMSTNFKFPDHKLSLKLRLDEEDLTTWRTRSEGFLDGSDRHGILFRFRYKRSRESNPDIDQYLGWFVIDSVSATLAEEAGRLTSGGAGGRLEWDTTIDLQRRSLNDKAISGLTDNEAIFGYP